MSAKWTSTCFGLMLDYELPPGCDVVALCVQKHQMEPVTVCLPHQVYREKLQRLMNEHATNQIHIIPYRSADVLHFKDTDLFPEGRTSSPISSHHGVSK